MPGKTNPIFLNGVPEFIILKLLAEKEMYGYEIVKTIKEASKNVFSFGEGCVYPILHALKEQGMVKVRNEIVNGRNRIFYKAATKGTRRLAQLSDEWTRVSVGISNIWETLE